MGLVVKPNTFSPGATIVAAEHNSNFDTIYDSHNGGISNANISLTAAILESKIDFATTGGHDHDGTSGGGTKADLSAPNAIGGTTPAAGAFTTVDGALGSVTPSTMVGTSLKLTGAVIATDILDEDTMVSDSNVKLATQQSIKAYVDTIITPTSFLVYAAGQANLAVGTTTVTFNNEIFDNGNNFASNTFTAPTTGVYSFHVQVTLEQVDFDSSSVVLSLVTTNRSYQKVIYPATENRADSGGVIGFSVIANMTATHTAYVTYGQNGGAAQTDLTAANSYFCGALLSK